MSEGNIKKLVNININKKQLPTDYLVVRLQLVHVRKGLFGLKDKELVKHSCIPNTRKEAADIIKRIVNILEEYGVNVIGTSDGTEKGGKK